MSQGLCFLCVIASVGTVTAVEADACRPCAGRGGNVLTHPLSRVSSACLYKSQITPYGPDEASFYSGCFRTTLFPLRWANGDYTIVALDIIEMKGYAGMVCVCLGFQKRVWRTQTDERNSSPKNESTEVKKSWKKVDGVKVVQVYIQRLLKAFECCPSLSFLEMSFSESLNHSSIHWLWLIESFIQMDTVTFLTLYSSKCSKESKCKCKCKCHGVR